MKLTIAFLQLLPAGSLEENMEKGIMACREVREKAFSQQSWTLIGCGIIARMKSGDSEIVARSCTEN